MDTTIALEFFSDTEQHLKTLEHRLKHVHDIDVYLVEPKDKDAPALVSIGINKSGDRAEKAAQNVAQVLYGFVHEDTGTQGQKKILLFTIEGERVDIEPLSVEEVEKIIVAAKEGESA